jgi:hypothetical protein
MSMGQAFSQVLPPSHQQALQTAADLLIDTYLDDLLAADVQDWHFEHFFISDLLPPRYFPKYSPHFARQFFLCLTTVAWKFNQLDFIPFACVGEELAAWILIEQAEDIVEESGEKSDFERLEGMAFEDTDFLNLFGGDADGIDETPLAGVMGMTSLRLDDWVKPFQDTVDKGFAAVHRYLQTTAEKHQRSLDLDDTDEN